MIAAPTRSFTTGFPAAAVAPPAEAEHAGEFPRPSLRERLREKITRFLDRLDEQWDDDLTGRWSGSCCFRHDAHLPERVSVHAGR